MEFVILKLAKSEVGHVENDAEICRRRGFQSTVLLYAREEHLGPDTYCRLDPERNWNIWMRKGKQEINSEERRRREKKKQRVLLVSLQKWTLKMLTTLWMGDFVSRSHWVRTYWLLHAIRYLTARAVRSARTLVGLWRPTTTTLKALRLLRASSCPSDFIWLVVWDGQQKTTRAYDTSDTHGGQIGQEIQSSDNNLVAVKGVSVGS